MRISAALIIATFLGSALLAHAQQSKESSGPAVYKVEFDIRDSGEAQSSQHFTMLIDDSRKGIFQAANRVPVATGSPQYVDVGVNIECTVHESDGKAVLSGAIESISIKGYVNLSAISQPIIGQRKVAFDTTVLLGKLTVIAGGLPVPAHRTNTLRSEISTEPPAADATREVKATVTKLN